MYWPARTGRIFIDWEDIHVCRQSKDIDKIRKRRRRTCQFPQRTVCTQRRPRRRRRRAGRRRDLRSWRGAEHIAGLPPQEKICGQRRGSRRQKAVSRSGCWRYHFKSTGRNGRQRSGVRQGDRGYVGGQPPADYIEGRQGRTREPTLRNCHHAGSQVCAAGTAVPGAVDHAGTESDRGCRSCRIP